MRLGVNLLYLRPGRVGGSEVYVRSLLATLAPMLDQRIAVFCSAETASSFRGEPRLDLIAVSDGEFSQVRRVWAENWRLRALLAKHPVDVLFSPGNFAATFLPVRIPQVATIHDLQHLCFPEYFTLAKRLGRSLMFRATLERCTRVITVSEFTRRGVIDHFGVADDLAVAIPLGFDAPQRPTEAQIASVKERHKILAPYAVYPATFTPHKNHLTLLAALARANEGSHRLHLVLTGDTPERFQPVVSMAKDLGVADAVRVLGFVPRTDLFSIIAGAQALLYPSRFEGFGLPLLEAMHLGVAVLSSDAASLPEVAGRAAILIRPDDVGGWAEAMRRVTIDARLRRELVAAGAENVTRFSWRRCAEESLRVLEDAAFSRSPASLALTPMSAPTGDVSATRPSGSRNPRNCG